jgi:uncharacterized membrane protein YeaQ/YmgE (transglycosylase-associated protein family)
MPSYLLVPRPGTAPAPRLGAGFGSETRGRIMTDWEVVMGIIGWIVLGLIAGAIAKAILPGRQGGGWLITLILGVVGALLGGFIGGAIFNVDLGGFFDLRTWLLAIGGSIIVLLIYGLVTRGSSRRA